MLNELYRLSESLQNANIMPYDWHKDFKPLPKATDKKPCYQILLGIEGEVTDILPIFTDLGEQVRKWEPSNGNSFPAFNLQPLYRITDPERKKLLEKWRKGQSPPDCEQLHSWCSEEASRNWDDKIAAKLECCLNKIPQTFALKLGEIPELHMAVGDLLTRCAAYGAKSAISGHFFREALERRLWHQLKAGEQIPQLLPFLIHESNPGKIPSQDRGSVSVCLDVAQWTDYPVVHHKTTMWINECLMNQTDALSGVTFLDAFALDGAGAEDKLPEVKLPILGGVKLRAMNSEIPCQSRYQTMDAASFPVGKESRRRMKGALEWLSAPEREGFTWSRADVKELIFAYPSEMPASPLKIAAFLGTSNTDSDPVCFEEYVQEVLAGLRGLSRPLKEIELQIFSLRKMDKARTKVVFQRNYTAQRLADAAAEWQAGCRNIPHMVWRVWGEEKGKWFEVRPETPFPLQIAKCLNQVWKMDGSTSNTLSVFSSSVGIELLLDEHVSLRLIPYLQTIMLQNGKGLLLALGNLMHKGEVLTIRNDYDRQKAWLPAIAGLLLYKLGIKKELYMNRGPYLIGNLLKVCDDLHVLYCKEMHSNKLPPQLLGNALMAAAADSPEQALSQLALRISPYLGWARSNNSDSANLAHHFLKGFGEIGAKLKEQALPQRLNDADRAQLLLGYLAK
jgi:hypothetical protein